ncbi:sigma-E processing peptidase SpoIIGA [Halothermothrix orenii]|uniref:Sporulation sigma-E factor-processing peptidase n=1 Tax=Halothermothrix orenii (strain H 168 / OCM 544 / DSM 9562) TaxID=373903 RepID=B8CWK1_HALOH|nr:sigma-E processing peptidase SpoIIGA [Halothermothrix orenii]ACL69670.1 peptidase U4 sporulation factor SpoIIGA [Halothermothrix orenii H 168]
MVIYADITFINNFLMTLAIIWAVGHILEYKTSWIRLLLAALIGTIYLFVIIIIKIYQLSLFINIAIHILLNILIAIAMVRVAFGRISKKHLWKGVGYLYLVSFITIGTTISIFYMYGGAPIQSSGFVLRVVGLLILVVIARYGWKFVQSYVTPDNFFVPVTIVTGDHRIRLKGLVDTGNKLKDPLTGVPVVIVYIKDIIELFPDKIKNKINSRNYDIYKIISIFNDDGWGNRVRVLPFSDLGQEHGILLGFRPDTIIIEYKDNYIKTRKVIIGLSGHKLDDEDSYQVLLHPQLIRLPV